MKNISMLCGLYTVISFVSTRQGLVSLLLDRDTKQLLSVMYWIQDKKRKRGDEDLERCSFSLLQSFHFCPLFVASVYFSYQFYYF